jgi:hypothetical protein
MKMIKSIHEELTDDESSSNSDKEDELKGFSIAEQEEKYGESIEEYY